MSNTVQPARGRSVSRMPLAVVMGLGLVLAACGGGGGGNGVTEYTLRVAFANETASDATIQLNEDGEPGTVTSCRADTFAFPLPATDWVLLVNGETVIDSLELETRLLDRNLTALVTANEDGTVVAEQVNAGSMVQVPAAAGICR